MGTSTPNTDDLQTDPSLTKESPAARKLPVTNNLRLVYVFSLILAALTAAASIVSIVFRDRIYPAEHLVPYFLPNDVVNLLVGLPVLLGSIFLARRGSLVGLLFWPCALFYALYNYLTYLLGMPFGVMYIVHMVIVTLCIYTLIGLIASIDSGAVKNQLSGNVPERLTGGVLFVAGIAFALLALITIEIAELSDENLHPAALAISTADFIVSAAWVIGGVMMWRKKSLGYVLGPGLLFNLSMLFVGLLVILLIQPLITDLPFSIFDVVVLLIMTLISFIPLILFIRGIRNPLIS